ALVYVCDHLILLPGKRQGKGGKVGRLAGSGFVPEALQAVQVRYHHTLHIVLVHFYAKAGGGSAGQRVVAIKGRRVHHAMMVAVYVGVNAAYLGCSAAIAFQGKIPIVSALGPYCGVWRGLFLQHLCRNEPGACKGGNGYISVGSFEDVLYFFFG